MTKRLQLGVAFGLGVVVTAGVGGLVLSQYSAPAITTAINIPATQDSLPPDDHHLAARPASALVIEEVGFELSQSDQQWQENPPSWLTGELYIGNPPAIVDGWVCQGVSILPDRLYDAAVQPVEIDVDEILASGPFGTAMLYFDGPLDSGPLALEFPDDSTAVGDAGLSLIQWRDHALAVDLPSLFRNHRSVRDERSIRDMLSDFIPLRCAGPRIVPWEPALVEALAVDIDAIIASLGEPAF